MSGMKKIIFLALTLLLVNCSMAMAASSSRAVTGQNSVKIAVVPYLATSEQDKDYVPGIVDEGYTTYFSSLPGVTVVPAADTQAALRAAGYDKSDMVLPEKETLAAVAQATGADYVVAMELSSLNAIRHVSLFQYKISVNVKLEYHFYSAKKDTMMPFKTTGANDNATIIGDVGFKAPIKASLQQAMKKANDKISAAMRSDIPVNPARQLKQTAA